jgi:hypothetical protein
MKSFVMTNGKAILSIILIVGVALVACNGTALNCLAQAGAPPDAAQVTYENVIQPMITAACGECHGDNKRKADLDLRSKAAMLKGGESGPALVPGSAEKSLIYQMVRDGKMPPRKDAKLTSKQIGLLKTWIDAGAHAPKVGVARTIAPGDRVTDEARKFWAFQKPVRPPMPVVRQAERVRTPIDAFILAKLAAKGLGLAPDADRITLLRRVSYDLLGLPPAPADIDSYLADDRPDAYERLLDRLLASPHYGERWGRHWLDAAGYVDTLGLDNDAALTYSGVEEIWRYRDYVVRSLNEDKPYDRFLTEQLAGDELEDWRSVEKFTPQIIDHLTATGFLRTAADSTFAMDIPAERYDVLHRTLDVMATNLLGLTVGCARCHDHKFDPIPQEEYYRLEACLMPAFNPDSWVRPGERHFDDVSANDKEGILHHNAVLDGQVAYLNRQLAELRRPHQQKLFEAKLAAVPEVLRADVRAALAVAPDKRSEVQKYLAAKLGPMLRVVPEEVRKALNVTELARSEQLMRLAADLGKRKQSFGKIVGAYDVKPAAVTRLLRRGDHLSPGREVQPGFVAALTNGKDTALLAPPAPAAKSSGRRTALARWLTRPEHPLTARVIVNRVWQHFFGEGIVATPENFGHSGARPTHPELLDWLATEFVRGGWRLKPLHKLILSSTVYRQASARSPAAATQPDPERIDPANTLLWRARLRRAESEVIRDAILAVSGQLDQTMGGPPIPVESRPDGMIVVEAKKLLTPTAQWRRSLYLFARRNYHVTLLSVFDQPIVATNCTRRTTSTVPLQALTLLNDAFMLEQAEHFAARVTRMAGTVPDRQIEEAFRLALARRPTDSESAWSTGLLERQTQRYMEQKLSPPQAGQKALASLCHMLLCASEFLYLR